jgi:hypothetical protein
MKEAKLDEEDIIIVPGQGKRLKPGLITKAKDRTDHEVEMAKSDLFQSAKNAKQIYELIKNIPETVGIEGWVQEKIIKANDYLNTVCEYLEHKQLSEETIEGKRDNFTVADIKDLEKIRDLETIKAKARELIKGKPDRRMKPEKIDYFYNKVDTLTSPMKVIKLMYDLLLAGEGMKTIGSRYSTSANSYQQRFNEMTDDVDEGYRIVPSIDKERYQEREGLEGPFRARNGKVYYYDPKAGLAYDPDTDMYIDYDELTMMDSDTMNENLQNDFAAFLQDLEKNTGIKGTIRKPGEQNIKPAYVAKPYSPEALEKMKAELPGLEADLRRLDPNGGYLERERYRHSKNRIGTIKSILAKSASDLDEGMLAKAGGALALIAALMGGNEITSAKHTPLGKALAVAAQQGDQEAAKHYNDLDTYIDTKQTALVTKLSNQYLGDPSLREAVVGNERPRETKKEDDRITAAYRKKHLSSAGKKNDVKKDGIKKESSIMKGLQNEAKKMKGKDPCWKDYEMIGKKKKNGKEVPNCVPKK